MTPAQIQTLIDACRTSPADLVTWLELKAVLEGLKNQDIGLVLTTTGTTGAATFDNDTDTLNIPNYTIDTSGFVPYTGATGNVTLGEYGMLSGWYRLDLTPTGTPTDQGTMYWDDNQKTLALIMNGTTQKVGHDQFYYVKNSTGSTIAKGKAVRFAGTDGTSGHLLIAPFLADGSNPSSYFMGVTSEEITNGSFGKVQSFGRLDGVDTSAFNDGDILYASTTVAGGFQTTVPVAPNNIVQVAAVVAATNNGKLLVRPTLGSKLTSDESVKLTSVTNGNVLQYNSTLSVWENVAPSSLAVSNIYTANGTLTGNRTVTMGTFDLLLSANRNGFLNFGVYNADITSTSTSARVGITVGESSISRFISLIKQSPNFTAYKFAAGGDGVLYNTNNGDITILNDFTAGRIKFGAGGSTTAQMTIFSNGNIGINTTTDAGFRLDVNGTARIIDQLRVSGSDPFLQIFRTGIMDARLYTASFTGITATGNSINAFESGNSTRASIAALHFFATGNIESSGGVIAMTSTTDNYIRWRETGNAERGVMGYADASSVLQIRVGGATNLSNGTLAMGIDSSGNVGIGTTSPTYKLHTVGTGRITGNVELSVDSGAYTFIGATGDTSYRLSVDGDLRVYGNIRTAQPTGGTGVGVWRLGSTATGTFTLDTTTCVEIEIGGTLYKLATVT